MKEKQKIISKWVVFVGILLSYYAMTVVNEIHLDLSIYGLLPLRKLLLSSSLPHIGTLILAACVFFLPYEKIDDMFHSNFFCEDKSCTPIIMKRMQILCTLLAYAIILLLDAYLEGFNYRDDLADMCIYIRVLFLIYMLVCSIEFFENEKRIYLFLFNSITIYLNSVVLFLDNNNRFTDAVFLGIVLNIIWYIYYQQSVKKINLKSLSFTVILNATLLMISIFAVGIDKTKELLSYFNFSQKNGSFNLKLSQYLAVITNHPFDNLYSIFGIVPLLAFLVAFVIHGICILYTKNYLSQKRYNFVLGLYLIFSFICVYTFIANIKPLPLTLFYRNWTAPYIYIISITIMIRLHFRKGESSI